MLAFEYRSVAFSLLYDVLLSTAAHFRYQNTILDDTVDSLIHCVTTESITTCQIRMVER